MNKFRRAGVTVIALAAGVAGVALTAGTAASADAASTTTVSSEAVAKRPSVLTTQQKSVLRPDAKGGIRVDGYLKARSTVGTLVPLAPGQLVWVQARPKGGKTYENIYPARTSKSGYFTTNSMTWLTKYHGSDVRFYFWSPFQTIASSYLWVGRVA